MISSAKILKSVTNNSNLSPIYFVSHICQTPSLIRDFGILVLPLSRLISNAVMKPNNLENFILSLIFLILYQIISILKIILFNLIIRAPPRISRGKTLPDARDSSRHVMMMRMMMKISRCFVFYKMALFNYTPCLNYILFDMVLVLWFLIASM